MLDLHKGARPDEKFHLQTGKPVAKVKRKWWGLGLVKIVTWSNLFLPDGQPGKFQSHWLIGNALYWYEGDCKCDGTRTRMYWAGQLDDGQGTPYVPDPNKFVMTTTPKEMYSMRFFVDPGEATWDGMGGS